MEVESHCSECGNRSRPCEVHIALTEKRKADARAGIDCGRKVMNAIQPKSRLRHIRASLARNREADATATSGDEYHYASNY
jgi:hypothetical protein